MAGQLELERLVIRILADADEFTKGLGKVESNVKDFAKRINGVGLKLVAAVTLPIVAMFGVMGKQAIAFESQMANVSKVMGKENTKGLAEEILAMTRTLPVAALGLGQIAEAGAQLGIGRKDISEFIDITSQMVVAFDILAEKAGTSIAKIKNQFELTMPAVRSLGDAINVLSNNASAAADGIVEATSRIAGGARSFGLAADQTAALATTAIELGNAPEVAATALNSVLTLLNTASANPMEKFHRGLERIGLNAEKLAANIKANPMAAIQDFTDRLGALDGQTRAIAVSEMFGTGGADVRVMLSMAQNTKLLTKNLDLLGSKDRHNSMLNEFNVRLATTEVNIQLLKNSLVEISITIGTALLPPLNALINTLRPTIEQVADWAKRNPEIVMQLLKMAAAAATVGPALLAIGFAAGQLAKLAGGFKLVLTLGTKLFAVLGGGSVVAAAAPLMPFIVGVTVLATTIAAFVAWFKGPGAFIAIWDQAKEKVLAFVDSTIGFFQHFQENISKIYSWLTDNWSTILQDMGVMWATFIGNSIHNFLTIGKAIMRTMAAVAGFLNEKLKAVFTTELWKSVSVGLQKVVGWFLQFGIRAWQALKAAFTGKKMDFSDFLGTLQTDAEQGATDIAGTLKGIWSEAMEDVRGPLTGFDAATPALALNLERIAGAEQKVAEQAPGIQGAAEAHKQHTQAMLEAEQAAMALAQRQLALQEGIDTYTKGLEEQVKVMQFSLKVGGANNRQIEIYKIHLQGATKEQLAHANALDQELTQLEKAHDKMLEIKDDSKVNVQFTVQGVDQLEKGTLEAEQRIAAWLENRQLRQTSQTQTGIAATVTPLQTPRVAAVPTTGQTTGIANTGPQSLFTPEALKHLETIARNTGEAAKGEKIVLKPAELRR